MGEVVTRSTPRALVLLISCVAASAGLLRLSWTHVETLEPWALQPQLGWGLLSLALLPAAALLASASYPQLRNPRLYALPFLLTPLTAIHLLHYANRPARGDAAPAAQATIAVVEPGGGARVLDTPVARKAPAREGPVARQFVGLPDSLAKRYPALPGQLVHLFDRLHALSLLPFPLVFVLATFAGSSASRRRLRLFTLAALALELGGLAALVQWGPADVATLAPPTHVLAATTALGLAAAALFWRSAAGLQGAVAGLILFLVPAAVAQLGVEPADLGLDLKRIPAASERVLLLAFPALTLLAVGHEWVIGMSHSTQTDALTQVFNKAYAESILDQTGATDLGSRFAVALLDIDHFKQVNDTYGHGAGDVVLQEVCRSISRTIANRGLVCRTGGEEITVFFPGSDLAGAREVAEEVRAAVEALTIKAATNSGKVERLEVTLSVGVATNLDDAGSARYARVRDVVEAADRALYRAKEQGRNRVLTD